MTGILSETFAPPRMATNGRSGSFEDAPEVLQLLLHQKPRGRLLDVLRDPRGRGVRAVRRAEGVVDVEVAERGELFGEPVVVLLLLLVEAQVFEQQHVAVIQLRDCRLGLLADTVVREG